MKRLLIGSLVMTLVLLNAGGTASAQSPLGSVVITLDNARQVKQLARFGKGTTDTVAWSPDGKTLAVASSIGVWLYEAADLSRPGRLLEGHTAPVISLAFSPDGTLLASGSMDEKIRLWDVRSGETLRILFHYPYETVRNWQVPVLGVAFSPDGKLLASASEDQSVCLWDVSSDVSLKPLSSSWPLQSLNGHTEWVRCVAFGLDGRLIASGGDDGTVRLWGIP